MHGPRIGGEITRDNGQLWLRLRARGDRVIADLPAPVGTPDPQATSANGSARTEGATDAARPLFDQAAERFDRAIRARADLHAPYNNRGNVSFFTGRYDEAIAYYRKATTLKTSYAAGF